MRNVRSDRDQSIERLLRETLKTRAASPSGQCLDAETVAAWADDALTVAERAAAEAHAADCARCQALVAAMARTSPVVDAKSWWRIPAAGWLIPLTAAAAAVLVWAVLPGRAKFGSDDRAVPAVSTVATTAAPPAAKSPPASSATDVASGTGKTDVVSGLSRTVTREGQGGAATREASAANIAGAAPAPAAAQPAAPALDAVASAAKARSLAASSAPSPSVADPSPAPVATPSAQSAAALGSIAAGRVGGRGGGAVSQNLIVSTDPSSRWRIVPGAPGSPGSVVQRSTDSGVSWQTQQTGATVTLAAGASPSPSVCWLVGAGGTVLLSTDGRSWQRVAFPEMTELVSVRATDDKTATVTASDGRTFSTRDGGLTWVRTPGV